MVRFEFRFLNDSNMEPCGIPTRILRRAPGRSDPQRLASLRDAKFNRNLFRGYRRVAPQPPANLCHPSGMKRPSADRPQGFLFSSVSRVFAPAPGWAANTICAGRRSPDLAHGAATISPLPFPRNLPIRFLSLRDEETIGGSTSRIPIFFRQPGLRASPRLGSKKKG
jgi:hypothetical protein